MNVNDKNSVFVVDFRSVSPAAASQLDSDHVTSSGTFRFSLFILWFHVNFFTNHSTNMAAVHLTLRMLRSIRLANQKIEFYKLTNQKNASKL